ncbi:hypothetical protein BOO92_19470 [Vibrio navarrensis]|uniref:hypothetical protein n=1 Tax=Vibrio navarrensis TaxID=29495 RepID=UPI001866D780|nr:hypothetical protein [Vibrio navarrensis]MBE3658854.1 hypothetical protein [Vibrio navarrensis]
MKLNQRKLSEIAMGLVIAGNFAVPSISTASVKQPFNPSQYDKVIVAPSDSTDFNAVGHDDSMGIRKLGGGIGTPPLPPHPVDPGKVEVPDKPDVPPEATTILLNCGPMKYRNETYPNGSPTFLSMEKQKEYLGEKFSVYYGTGISKSSSAQYSAEYDLNSGDVLKMYVTEGNTKTELSTETINTDTIFFSKIDKDSANKTCNIYVNNPSMKIDFGYTVYISGNDKRDPVNEHAKYIFYSKPGIGRTSSQLKADIEKIDRIGNIPSVSGYERYALVSKSSTTYYRNFSVYGWSIQ